jgi:Domain of unknown function (DUF4114)/PEP-CTERM motif
MSPESIKAKQINLSNMTLKYDHNVSTYFIGETAGGYRNRLDFKATSGNQVTGGKIFGDTSCSTGDSGFANFNSFCPNANDALNNKEQVDKPLNIGDWASVGDYKAGTTLDFLLHANDINGGISGQDSNGKTVPGIWSLNQALNPDGLQHTVSYFYKDFLIVGYEDLWGGGDKDYNDVVFAIDVGKENARAGIQSVPEPSAVAAILGLGALGLFKSRRRRSIKDVN